MNWASLLFLDMLCSSGLSVSVYYNLSLVDSPRFKMLKPRRFPLQHPMQDNARAKRVSSVHTPLLQEKRGSERLLCRRVLRIPFLECVTLSYIFNVNKSTFCTVEASAKSTPQMQGLTGRIVVE